MLYVVPIINSGGFKKVSKGLRKPHLMLDELLTSTF